MTTTLVRNTLEVCGFNRGLYYRQKENVYTPLVKVQGCFFFESICPDLEIELELPDITLLFIKPFIIKEPDTGIEEKSVKKVVF